MIASLLGIILGRGGVWLPFSIDIALAAMLFFYTGYKMKNYSLDTHPYNNLVLFTFVWIVSLRFTFPDVGQWTYMELAVRRYPLFPVCYIAAILGTLVFAQIGYILVKFKTLSRPIVYIGKNSMCLFFIHHLDVNWMKFWLVENHQFYSAAERIVVDLIVFYMVMIIMKGIKQFWRKDNG